MPLQVAEQSLPKQVQSPEVVAQVSSRLSHFSPEEPIASKQKIAIEHELSKLRQILNTIQHQEKMLMDKLRLIPAADSEDSQNHRHRISQNSSFGYNSLNSVISSPEIQNLSHIRPLEESQNLTSHLFSTDKAVESIQHSQKLSLLYPQQECQMYRPELLSVNSHFQSAAHMVELVSPRNEEDHQYIEVTLQN